MAEANRASRIDVHHHFYAPEYLAVMGDMAKRPPSDGRKIAQKKEQQTPNGVEMESGMVIPNLCRRSVGSLR